ncbi:Hypothetical_protein [Hexamita inflata]|uniref:Hypothetical_protein n=1 Tax=Hexamita inflata TaxID=28002 RepID=A0AA86TIY0_9EUKA|nr:Hypothetical protein HINF_LOCUS7694 [Hexamita inflata]
MYITILYISHFLETAQTDFIETFESKTLALARQCFHFQNRLSQSFMPTQQRPSRALTESLADQFHLIRQLTFQKLVLAQFLFARYFLRFAREVVPLYWHCLVVVAFDASFHQLDQVSFLVYLFLQIPNFGVYCWWQLTRWYLPQLSFFRQTISDILFNLELLLLGFRQDWLGFLFCVSYRILFILTIFWL